MVYVVVGFKVNQVKAVYYRTFKSKKGLAKFLEEYIDDVDFVSIRVVRSINMRIERR